MDNPAFLSVNEVNLLLKAKIEEDSDLQHLSVKGEISNFKHYSSACYFDLKDDKSVLSCLLWNDSYLYLPFEPKDGDEVIALGSIDVYAPRGRYSLMVSSLQLFGQGSALLQLEALKRKLQAEGLFDESRKRPIPAFPRKIGIIVGAGSAAEADLLKNLQRRWPLADLYFFPSLVQGKDAPAALLKAFQRAQSYPLDTLIIARGGGSSEDLGAFNDEKLARAVAASKMPTISAVGHEIDTTLIDYVSDKRVSTPTGAAEAATPDQKDIRQGLLDAQIRLGNALRDDIAGLTDRLHLLSSRPFFKNPAVAYAEKEDEVEALAQRLENAEKNAFSLKQESLKSSALRLKALNPYGVLKRGYSLTQTAEGKIVKKVGDAPKGARLKTQVEDGIITSKVE